MNLEQQILDIIDYLDSSDLGRVAIGVDKLDGLLHQLLPSIKQYHQQQQNDVIDKFIRLQDNFQYNMAGYLLNYYRIQQDAKQTIKCNQCLQGLLLLHKQSRKLFNRKSNLQLIVSTLKNGQDIDVIISTITTIIHILLKDLQNFRNFEDLLGCSIIIKYLNFDKMIEQVKDVKDQKLNFKIIEFLIFYLIDESNMVGLGPTKSIQEKSNLFKQEFPEIDQLIYSLRELNHEVKFNLIKSGNIS